MRQHAKPFFVCAAGTFLVLGLLAQTASAQSTLGILADSLGASTGPEVLTVNSVVSYSGGIYTYSYTLNNPSGDVNLTTGSPETVSSYSVGFDTTLAGNLISGSQTGGIHFFDNMTSGVKWALSPLSPGFSTTVSFESYNAPIFGNANAQSSAAGPSPWATNPSGSPVFVPTVVPEPGVVSLLVGGLFLMPVGTFFRRKR